MRPMKLSKYLHSVAVRHEATENHQLVDHAYDAFQRVLILEHTLQVEASRAPISIERLREILATAGDTAEGEAH